MGRIMSHAEGIERIDFKGLKNGEVTKASRVLRVDNLVLIELAEGRIVAFEKYGTKFILEGAIAMLGYGSRGLSRTVLRGLVRFGIFTKEDVDEHVRRVRARAKTRDEKYALESLEKAMETLQLELTPEQRRQVYGE